MASPPLTPADTMNIIGISAQMLGFIILALDLWPEYRKMKKIQMIMAFRWFIKFAADRFENDDPKAVYFNYAMAKDALMEADKEIRRHWGDNYPIKMIDEISYNKESVKLIDSRLEDEAENWVEKIKSKKTFRNMYVGEAIFVVIIGYLLQIAAVLVAAKRWPFSLIT